MTSLSSTRRTIVQLLSNITDGKEIRAYLQRFSRADRSGFAVIKTGGAVLQESMEEVAGALAFLHTVGLTPIVLHGGGPQLDEELSRRGIRTEKAGGLRVTPAGALDAACDVFMAENIRFVQAIRSHGVEAQSLPTGVIRAGYLDRERYGLVGEPSGIRHELIRSVIGSGAIPVMACLGVVPGGQLVNVNADSATRVLVRALQPMKIVFLSGVGGLLDAEGKLIHNINLASDYEELMRKDWVSGGMRLKIEEIRRLLDDIPASSSVSITTPSGLVRELFTHGGSGTLIRKGEVIRHITDRAVLCGDRVVTLIEDAFKRKLEPGWWSGLSLHTAYVSGSYRAGAFLAEVDDFLYLDKFAVVEDARGEGLAHTVWRHLDSGHPSFFWRSRTDNPFNGFYTSVATGQVRSGPWTVFWKGERDFRRIGRIVSRITAMKPAFGSET